MNTIKRFKKLRKKVFRQFKNPEDMSVYEFFEKYRLLLNGLKDYNNE